MSGSREPSKGRVVVKPPALRPGDMVGVVAPSWCGPALFPHRLERGVALLEHLGYRVVLGEHVYGRHDYVSGTPEERVADLHRFFADPDVRAIIAAIGGDHSCHLLPLLDFELIRRNPTILIGYSDVTVLNVAIYGRTGLTTFNGPTLMTDLAEFPEPFSYTLDSMLRVLGESRPYGQVHPAREWTEERLSWSGKLDLTRARVRSPSRGWTWLKEGLARGPLVGGCAESLQHLRGTPFWPDLEGAILFLETSEHARGPAWVDGLLQDYDNMGVLGKISGLLVGRPVGFTETQKQALHAVLLERTRHYAFPIIADADFGHTAPQFTLPLGCHAEIDAVERWFAIIEAAVSAECEPSDVVSRGGDPTRS